MEDFWGKIAVYGTIIILGALITLFTFDTWETVLIVTILLTVVSYLAIFSIDRLTTINCGTIREGFISEGEESYASKSKYEWLTNDDLFDDFYASVFTKLTQNENLIQAETAIWIRSIVRAKRISIDANVVLPSTASAYPKNGLGIFSAAIILFFTYSISSNPVNVIPGSVSIAVVELPPRTGK